MRKVLQVLILLLLLCCGAGFLLTAFGQDGFHFVPLLISAALLALCAGLALWWLPPMLPPAPDTVRDEGFVRIALSDTPHTLRQRLLQDGFSQQEGLLCKKEHSLTRGTLHYSLQLLWDGDLQDAVADVLQQQEEQRRSRQLFRSNQVAYLVCFRQSVSQQELAQLAEHFRRSDLLQEVPPYVADAVIPVMYDLSAGEYLLWEAQHGLALKTLHTGLRRFRTFLNRQK